MIAGDGNDDGLLVLGDRGNTGMSAGETLDLGVLETCDVAGLEHWALCLWMTLAYLILVYSQ